MNSNHNIAVPGLDKSVSLTHPLRSIFMPLRRLDAALLRFCAGALCLVGLVFVCYRPLMPGSFVMDDQRLIQLDNPLVTGALRPHTIWFQSDFPLSTLALWLQWRAWGQNPAGYHIVNMLLQGVSAIVLWRLLVRLKIPGAWLAAAVFAVHPVCVNSVGRIAEIKNTLSLPFFLLSFLSFLRHESYWLNPPKQDHHHRAALWYGLALISFVLALFSKTSTVMLPIILLGCAAWQRGRISRQDLWHVSPFLFLSLAFGLMSAWFQKHQALAGQVLDPVSFWQRLAGAGHNLWFYLGKTLLPYHLNVVYARWKVDAAMWTAYLPLLVAGTILILCWRYRRSWGRHVLFGLGCFAVTLFPALGFLDAQFLTKYQVSDHLQYLPLIAPVTLAVAGLASLLNAKALKFAAAPLILLLAVSTFQRANVFATEERLWRDTLAKNPAAWGAANDLGCILAERKNYPEAAAFFMASLQTNPDNADAHSNLGQILVFQGQVAEAESHFFAALKLNPNHLSAHKRFAELLGRQERNWEALDHFRKAVALHPEFDTHVSLATICYKTGNHRMAVTQLRSALSLNAQLPELQSNLAWFLATSPDDAVRDGAEAVQHAEQACRLTGFAQPSMVGTLAAAYAEARRFPEAISACERTVQLAEQTGATQFAAVNRQLLTLYRGNKPYHERPARPDQKRNSNL